MHEMQKFSSLVKAIRPYLRTLVTLIAAGYKNLGQNHILPAESMAKTQIFGHHLWILQN